MRAATTLVQAARGRLTDNGWRTEQNILASMDDITCFVIPLKNAAQSMSSYTFVKETSSSPTDELASAQHPEAPAENEKKSDNFESSEQKHEDIDSDSVSESAVDVQVRDGQETNGTTSVSDGEEPECSESKELSDFEMV